MRPSILHAELELRSVGMSLAWLTPDPLAPIVHLLLLTANAVLHECIPAAQWFRAV